MRLFQVVLLFLIIPITSVQAAGLGDYYVNVPVLNERATPGGKIVNRIYKGQKVTVYFIKGSWAQVVTPGYKQRWVSMKHLVKKRPKPAKANNIQKNLKDPRIMKDAIPKVGQYGLTKKDVDILWKGANLMLKKGRCSKIHYADKSLNKANTYYVNCGSRNIFFTKADVYR